MASLSKPPAGFLFNIHFTNCHRLYFFIYFFLFQFSSQNISFLTAFLSLSSLFTLPTFLWCSFFFLTDLFHLLLYFCHVSASINISLENSFGLCPLTLCFCSWLHFFFSLRISINYVYHLSRWWKWLLVFKQLSLLMRNKFKYKCV